MSEDILMGRAGRGLLADTRDEMRGATFSALLIVCAAMVATRLGIIEIIANDAIATCLMGILVPVAIAALLLGWRLGCALGLIGGVLLYARVALQPFSVTEYFVLPSNSILPLGLTGLALGLSFAFVSHLGLEGARRHATMAVSCVLVSSLASLLFFAPFIVAQQTSRSVLFLGLAPLQGAGDAVLMAAASIACDLLVLRLRDTRAHIKLNVILRLNMLLMLALVYALVCALSFNVISEGERRTAHEHMRRELEFLTTHIANGWTVLDELQGDPAYESLSDKVKSALSDELLATHLVSGYDLEDGTVAILVGDSVLASDNPALVADGSFDKALMLLVKEAARDGALHETIYHADNQRLDLAYLAASRIGTTDAYAVMEMPYSMVYEDRGKPMLWMSIASLAILGVVFVATSFLLRRVVGSPIDSVNASLAEITKGRLDTVVREVDVVEFAMLSAGINITVDALKGWIGAARRQMEAELVTAKAIQEGMLPRSFPAFPGVETVSLYALMDAAKEVGGDFYDFFELDDHTVAFLVADVSGKGIPAALFMMAAKTEIQNHLSSGMRPADAVAATNVYLCDNNEADMFVTAWIATLDWQSGLLTYVNAGHNFPLLRHGRGGTWRWLSEGCNFVLGGFDTMTYEQRTMTLVPGDELVLYTDGVSEATNAEVEEYGIDRLEAFLADHPDERPEAVVRGIRANVAAWAEGIAQSDDVTILAVEYGVPTG